jgi:integrase/recombinase XerD
LRAATVEDVRDTLTSMSAGLSVASAHQYVLRIKSLLSYAHALGFTPFNAGATIKARSDAGSRGANLAKRIMSEVEVGLLIRAAPSKRDRVLLEVIYAGGLRVSETVALTWADVLPRDDRMQLSILGKGSKVRQVLLPDIVSRSLLSLRGDAGTNDPVFASRKGGHLTERAVNGMVKRTARKAGINEAVSPHWLRRAHGSHAIDRGASLMWIRHCVDYLFAGERRGPSHGHFHNLLSDLYRDRVAARLLRYAWRFACRAYPRHWCSAH